MRHIVIEGLPAAGKSETLQLLARFYPDQVKVFPELVKELAIREGIDIFSERQRLTESIIAELPARAKRLSTALESGKLCIEESHLGVHLAYSRALDDSVFIEAYPSIEDLLPSPDLYLRFDIPLDLSLTRQLARATERFDVPQSVLEDMLLSLRQWHLDRGTTFRSINANRPASVCVSDVEQLLDLSYSATPNVSHSNTFDVLLLLGRPASGKSEFIDLMLKSPTGRRAERYCMGPLEVVDDFPMLWQKFEEDDIWQQLGYSRKHSQPSRGNYYVTDERIWPFLIEQINRRIEELSILRSPSERGKTLLIEFSRGGKSAYADALAQLSDSILSRAVILYVSVSAEESWKRNIARYDENKRDGILTHSVPKEEMEKTYGVDDWQDLTTDSHGIIDVRGHTLPFVTMQNEPELTDVKQLDQRYSAALDQLRDIADDVDL